MPILIQISRRLRGLTAHRAALLLTTLAVVIAQ